MVPIAGLKANLVEVV